MFNKDIKEVSIKEAETIIGPSIVVKGNFNGQGNIIIEGTVEGSVKTSNSLLIGNKATITADIDAKEARVGGAVHGNIKVSGYLEITNTAKITGDVEAAEISIERGAFLNGNCKMSGHEKTDKIKNN